MKVLILDGRPAKPIQYCLGPVLSTQKDAAGPTLQLVESYRDDDRRPRQRIVDILSNADIAPKDWTLLAKMIERRLRGEAEDLLDRDFPEALRSWADRIVHLVDQDQISWRPRRPNRSASAPVAEAAAETATGETIAGLAPVRMSALRESPRTAT